MSGWDPGNARSFKLEMEGGGSEDAREKDESHTAVLEDRGRWPHARDAGATGTWNGRVCSPQPAQGQQPGHLPASRSVVTSLGPVR